MSAAKSNTLYRVIIWYVSWHLYMVLQQCPYAVCTCSNGSPVPSRSRFYQGFIKGWPPEVYSMSRLPNWQFFKCKKINDQFSLQPILTLLKIIILGIRLLVKVLILETFWENSSNLHIINIFKEWLSKFYLIVSMNKGKVGFI